MTEKIKTYQLPCILKCIGIVDKNTYECIYVSKYCPEGSNRFIKKDMSITHTQLEQLADRKSDNHSVGYEVDMYIKGDFHLVNGDVSMVKLISIGSKANNERCRLNAINKQYGSNWAEDWARAGEYS